MTLATLLLRETCSKSSLQEVLDHAIKYGQQSKYAPMHRLVLNAKQLIIRRVPSSSDCKVDEGFESDMDSISIISTESAASKSRDSANGSSDSDQDQPPRTLSSEFEECFNLVNCVCYTADWKSPFILILHVKQSKDEQRLIFKFQSTEELEAFHANFSTVKAVANQRKYCSNFNLLQRTDHNGITHIRISNTLPSRIESADEDIQQPSSIISLQAPLLQKSKSSEDLLEERERKVLRKVWNSAENLLDDDKTKRKPKRKKGPAPQPPQKPENVLQGQHVRVQVDPYKKNTNFQAFKFSDPKNVNGYCCGSLPRPCFRYSEVHPKMVFQSYTLREPRGFHLSSYIPARFKPSFSERLFGMSSKLKEFSSLPPSITAMPEVGGTLKSVIKKKRSDDKRSKEKKVTFSAYNTIQVV